MLKIADVLKVSLLQGVKVLEEQIERYLEHKKRFYKIWTGYILVHSKTCFIDVGSFLGIVTKFCRTFFVSSRIHIL